MQPLARLTLALLLTATWNGPAWAKTDAKPAEYKRNDPNFYLRSDVLKLQPNAVIYSGGGYTHKGDSYFIPAGKKAPGTIYIQVVNNWIEPITPPNMPASLGIAPDAMQIREPQGDVQVALPSAPANFVPATEGMAIPNGAVVKTGANATAAILFGGVDSVRLTPHSQAAVQQTVTAQLRSTEIDLTAGAAFSKVGQRPGEKQAYKVHTPFGIAAARGTDFVTVVMPARTDVWVAQGTVELVGPDGKRMGMVKSEGTGSLKIIRSPVMADPHQAMMADSETMTMALNFIPVADGKVRALRNRMAKGEKLSANEQKYLSLIKKVPALIKLTLVEPPAPPPVIAPPPMVAPAPVLMPVPVVAPTPAAPIIPAVKPKPAPKPSQPKPTQPKTIKPKPPITPAAPSSAPAPIATGPGDTVP